jgi:hypothetical protein
MIADKKMRLLQQSELPQLSRPREGLKRFLVDGFSYPFVLRRASARGPENSARICLSPPQAGEFPRSGRIDDAQDQAGHGRFLLVRFLSRERK